MPYATVHDAVNIINLLGRDTQLIKLDLKDAYRIVPVHPADYTLLGITWQGQLYLDRALPFGLRSAPKLFNAVADLTTCMGTPLQGHSTSDTLLRRLPLPSTPKLRSGEAYTRHSISNTRLPRNPSGITKNRRSNHHTNILRDPYNTHTFELQLYPVINYIALNSC